MHVIVGAGGVSLERPEELDRFDVRRRDGVDVAEVIERHRWGSVTEGGDVMVAVDRLRAAGPDDDAWRRGLDAMVAYAATKGWLDATGEHVQAHVVDES